MGYELYAYILKQKERKTFSVVISSTFHEFHCLIDCRTREYIFRKLRWTIYYFHTVHLATYWLFMFKKKLFIKLSDTPSTNRLLPLVNLTNLQITSRGRVVFNVMPAGQMNTDNGVTPFSDTSFLSPEYLNNIGKKTSFSESDIEKVKYTQLSLNCK